MIARILSSKILAFAKKYPVITVTGPRQSGKTTLVRQLFPRKLYFSLEDLDVRREAQNDPRTFLERCLRTGAILDEIQRVPDLLSYIQTLVDRKNKTGTFILTGSQNFQLLNSIAQTLAGRTALATLLPFSYDEIYRSGPPASLDQLLYTGFYPRIHDQKLNPSEALSFYVSTHLERDIRSLIHVKDLSKFETFLKLCASRTAQILNLSNLGNDCGINHNTAKSWLSVLETSYILHLVRPHHKNFRKRLVKAPKMYFVDVGLAAYLLNIRRPKHVDSHPLKGALFETFVAGEILKHQLNRGKTGNLYYFRDNAGNEVDLILEEGLDLAPIEIKLGKTVNEDFFRGLRYYRKLNPKVPKTYLIYGGHASYSREDSEVIGYQEIHSKLP